MIQLGGFVLHHATCEETVELMSLLLFKLCHPYYNHLWIWSPVQFALQSNQTKPNKQKHPNNKRFQSKAMQ
jgi:hypothetical protein